MRRCFALLVLVVPLIALPGCGGGNDAPAPRPESAAARAAGPEVGLPPLQPQDGRTLYRLTARLDTRGHAVDGNGELLWTNTSSRDVDQIFLYLHLNAFRDRTTTFMRESGGVLRRESYGGPGSIDVTRLEIDGRDALGRAEASETWLRVPLLRPVPPGGTLTVAATWRALLPPIFARTGWKDSFHLVAQWFPKLPVLTPDGSWALRERHANAEFFSDHADYDVDLDVPAGWVVGAGGEEEEAPASGAPAPGRERHRFVLRRAVDFAWTAWDHFSELDEEVDGVALRWLYPAGAQRTLLRQRAAVGVALPRFQDWFGTMPYPRLTLVLVPRGADGAGGMEYPGFVTTTSSPALPGYRDDQEVAVHELAHQWFYALVATDEAREPWLDEGVVTFVTGAALDAAFGEDRSIVSAGPLGIGYFPSRRACWRLVDARQPIDRAADAYPSFDAYAGTVYCRASVALDALGATAGRAAVLRGLGRYLAAHRFAVAHRDDLYAALAAEAGAGPVDRVLRRAVEADDGIDLQLEEVRVRRVERDEELLAPRTSAGPRWVTSFVVRRRGPAVGVPVEVEVRFPGLVRRAWWDGRGAGARFALQADRPPESILIDPDRRVLLDRNLLDNGWRARDPSFTGGLGDEVLAGYGGLLEVLF